MQVSRISTITPSISLLATSQSSRETLNRATSKSTMSPQNDYTLAPTGFPISLPISLPVRDHLRWQGVHFHPTASPKYRRKISLPHITRRGPRSFSRWLRRRCSTSRASESGIEGASTDDDDAEYDSTFKGIPLSPKFWPYKYLVFQDDRFKPGLFFPHRAGPLVTFDEKTTIFYCSDEEQAGTWTEKLHRTYD